MTTDPFTTAATERAAATYQGDWDAYEQEPVDDYGYSEVQRKGFVAGAEWARTHLAAQEPTDAECIAILNAVTVPLGEGPGDGVWFRAAIRRCREAMMSARAARRDEEQS